MNILVINGSPRMERSNSLRMTRAFLEGLAKTCDTQVEELTVMILDSTLQGVM